MSMVGKWENRINGQFYVFFEDGKFMTNASKGGEGLMGTYMFVDNVLAISIPGYDLSGRRYEVQGNLLTVIADGFYYNYTKRS